MAFFAWLNDQLLRMDWLAYLVRLLLEDGFGLDMLSRVGASLHFFIYDVIKIFILLAVLIFSVSWVQSYFPPERTRLILGRMRGVRGNLMGALLGTITPFCSCSSIPLFIGFTGSGLPLGVTFSFLISSPLVDLASVILLASIFNWSIALTYVLVGIVLAVLGGSLISQARMERYVEGFVLHSKVLDLPPTQLTRRDRLQFSREQVGDVFSRVWLYVLIGVGIGASIHNWIPQDLIITLIGEDNWWSVPLANCRGAGGQGRWPRYGTGLHDGGDGAVVTVADHAQESGQGTAAGAVFQHRAGWHRADRLSVQQLCLFVHLTCKVHRDDYQGSR
jgi:hypothetical protein